jgi:hypothetical protein
MALAALMLIGAAAAGSGDVAFDETHGGLDRPDPPEWLVTEMRRLVAGGDQWIADNTEHVSDAEPWQQYGLAWRYAEDGNGVTGRLFGLIDGEDRATFWELRLTWDEERREAVVWQRSTDGATTGVGTMKAAPNGIETDAIQTFTAPDGTTSVIRHIATTTDDRHVTQSFDRVRDEWVPRRQYVWKRTGSGSGAGSSP